MTNTTMIKVNGNDLKLIGDIAKKIKGTNIYVGKTISTYSIMHDRDDTTLKVMIQNDDGGNDGKMFVLPRVDIFKKEKDYVITEDCIMEGDERKIKINSYVEDDKEMISLPNDWVEISYENIKKAELFLSNDVLRPQLRELSINDNILFATDGYRLIQIKLKNTVKTGMGIPKKVIDLIKIIKKDIKIGAIKHMGKDMVMIEVGNVLIQYDNIYKGGTFEVESQNKFFNKIDDTYLSVKIDKKDIKENKSDVAKLKKQGSKKEYDVVEMALNVKEGTISYSDKIIVKNDSLKSIDRDFAYDEILVNADFLYKGLVAVENENVFISTKNEHDAIFLKDDDIRVLILPRRK